MYIHSPHRPYCIIINSSFKSFSPLKILDSQGMVGEQVVRTDWLRLLNNIAIKACTTNWSIDKLCRQLQTHKISPRHSSPLAVSSDVIWYSKIRRSVTCADSVRRPRIPLIRLCLIKLDRFRFINLYSSLSTIGWVPTFPILVGGLVVWIKSPQSKFGSSKRTDNFQNAKYTVLSILDYF